MSEQHAPFPDDFHTWLTERGGDAYALAWVAAGSDPTGWAATEAPRVGESGIARAGSDLTRIEVQEVTYGRSETLRRWLQLDNGVGHLAILTTEDSGLREHTPGELAAELMHSPDTDEAQLTGLLASWLYRRNADAPQEFELGWIAAAAAWSCHMRALSSCPPSAVLDQSLQNTDEHDEATAELVDSTALKMAGLLDRLEGVYRPRPEERIEDWHTVKSLAADVPALTELADWLLDQIALRDAHAQQLRAVLEPDITDHLQDRRADGHLLGAVRILDEQRTAHLSQARETVRAYTTAVHSGRGQEAQQLLDAFPIPARSLTTSEPTAAWRRTSATAQAAIEDLTAQRAATTAEDGADYFADPELLHAQTAYLAAREGQLDLIHDALGRLAHPVSAPRDLPEELAPVATAQPQRRLMEAFGTLDRAHQVLDGQISYLLQQPTPGHRRATTGAEVDLLTRVRGALEQVSSPGTPLNEDDIRARAKNFRDRLQQAMARPAAPDDPAPAARTAHDDSHTHAQALALALAPGPATPEVHR